MEQHPVSRLDAIEKAHPDLFGELKDGGTTKVERKGDGLSIAAKAKRSG
jgi:hypothetical protein